VQDVQDSHRLEEVIALRAEVERLRARLAEAEERADRAQAEQQELVYVASHDLTEPLRMVRSYLQLLERRLGDQLDERGREFVYYAVDGADRMGALIEDLLRYSRAGGSDLRREPVACDEVLEGVLRGLARLIAAEHADVRADGPLPTVLADPVQLGQLLQNLVANAVKFHRPGAGAHVVVRAQRDEDACAWRISVADDGVGVPAGGEERIFRVFQRLHSREEVEGNGIGLAICRRIVERHGGTIGVRPTPGGGATFTFTLPDAGAADPAEADA
jgi:signal transduction histidine kinase